MAKYLVIVESPAKSKTIKKFLGSSYKVEASMGHIRDLPKSKLGIDIEDHFTPRYINIRGKGELIKKLKSAAKKVDKVFLATDPDREGEAISWHLKNALNIPDDKSYRIAFNEITKDAVKNSVKNARDIDMNMVNAQQARRMLDRIVGYKISPLLWKKVAKGLSAGRVQSVALKMICEREEEIEAFVSKEYWTMKAVFEKDKVTFVSDLVTKNNKKIEINDKNEINNILEDIKKGKFVVSDIKYGEKNKNTLLPFKTSTLQQTAFSKLNFAPRKTMQIAQQLYEGIDLKNEGHVGLITYMRTDSTRLSDEFKNSAKEYIINEYGNEYVGKMVVKKAKKGVQDAHEAVRVTNLNLTPQKIKDNLSRDQYRLYKLIWERALASQMASAKYDTLAVKIDNGSYGFKSVGSKLKFDGFLRVYNIKEDEEKNKQIPDLDVNEILKEKELVDEQHFTKPKPRYTEASLVKKLEENGIGRPSTYATIISTIQARRYVTKEEKSLIPTELGRIVNDIMEKYFNNVVNINFTADLEQKLDQVAIGENEWKKVLEEFYDTFGVLLEKAEEQIQKIEIKEEVTDIKCEKCGRNMVIKHGRFGDFLACPGFPECRNAKPIRKETGVKCPKCDGMILEKKSKKGRLYFGCENNPECDFMSWDRPTNKKCPKCGEILYEKGRKNKRLVCHNDECNYKEEIKE